MSDTWQAAYDELTDLKIYNDNALGLFALGLKFGLEDLVGIGVDAVTDGADDKKLDIVYIDSEDGYAVIAQCYYSTKVRECAKSNKASDLNTGLAWLLQRDISEVPDRIKSAAINLRNGLKNGNIKKIYIWFVHNCPESTYSETELVTVHETATTILSSYYEGTKVDVLYKEVGVNTLKEWYEDCKTPILMNENVELNCSDGYEIKANGWASYSTAINARDLHRLYKKHKTKIFSANIRDYLGSRATDSNINYGIKNTIEKEPENFWAYNNGLTILTHGYELDNGTIRIKGMSIVNGAQTTGAIGSLRRLPSAEAKVQVRFIGVENDSDNLIESIIRYNNSQNKVEAADFRSTDKIQKRLKAEFELIPSADYDGGRRGSSADVIRRRPNLLGSYSVGQALSAFHGDPITAYNQKTGIWINNKSYEKIFNDNTKAAHIITCYALVKAIENKKQYLKGKSTLTEIEDTCLNFFRQRGSVYLSTYAISKCLELILDRKIPNLFRISFGTSCSLSRAIEIWTPVIDCLSPLMTQLFPAINNGLKNSSSIEKSVSGFTSMVASTKMYHSTIFTAFKTEVQATTSLALKKDRENSEV